MKKFLFWSHAIVIAVIGVAAANAQAQRGPATPQMRGDGPPPEARSFSITRADPALDHDDPIEEVFGDQIACADLVVLNKRDLLDAVGAEKAAEAIVRSLPRAVKIVPVAHGKVDPAALLGLGIGAEDDIANRHTRHDAELEHDHDDFESFVVPLPEIADPASLATRIAAAAADASVLRVKGFAAVAGKPMRLLVQAVGPRVSHHYDRAWTAAEKRQGRLVVIGMKGLNRDGIKRALSG